MDKVVALKAGEKGVNGRKTTEGSGWVKGQGAWEGARPQVVGKDGVSAGPEGKRGDRGRVLRPGQALTEAVVGVEMRVAGGVEGCDEVEAELVREASADVAGDAQEVAQKLAGEGRQAELWMLELDQGKAALQLLAPGGGSW